MITQSKKMYYGTIVLAVIASGILGGLITKTYFPTPAPEVEPEPEVKTENILFSLDWFYAGYHIPFFVALDKGYYNDEGLSVQIVRGYGSGDTSKRVDAGTVDIGLADTSAQIVSRTKGMSIKAIGAWMPHNIDTFIAFEKMGIESPKDFEGKSYGDVPGSSGYITLPAFCQINGVDLEKINLVNIDSSTRLSLFMTGQIDLTAVAIFDLIVYENAAAEIGETIDILRRTDWGQDTYSHSILASEEMISEKPEMLSAFLRASYKGLEYTIQNKAESIDIILKYVPELDRAKLEDNYDRFIEFEVGEVYDSGKRGTDMGLIDMERLQANIDLITSVNNVSSFDAEDMATNDLLVK